MVIIGMTYLASILVITPDYISVIVKHARIVYQAGVGTDWQTMASAAAPVSIALIYALLANIYLKVKIRDISPEYVVIFLVALANLGIFAIQFKGWPNHMYPVSAMAIILAAVFLVELYKYNRRTPQLVIVVLGITLLLPIYKMGLKNIPKVSTEAKAVAYFDRRIKSYEAKKPTNEPNVDSILIMSSLIETGFPLVNELKLDWGSRLPSMWMTPGIQHLKTSSNQSSKVIDVETFNHETIGQDLATRKPDIVFIDVSSKKDYFDFPYDYIEDYSQNETFRAAWSAYEWVESDENYALYRRR